MIVWLAPWALAGLAAVLGPVIVHLLRRQRARTLVVPTVRFIPTVDQSVVRVRMPADVALLLVRIAIVMCAALALARPLILTDARKAAWAERIARVTVVDVSNPPVVTLASEAAAAELRSATYSHRIDAAELGPALRRATAWLNSAPPARREVVVISDFQLGAIDEAALQAIPRTVGVRLMPVNIADQPSRDIAAGGALGPGVVFERSTRLDDTSTSAAYRRQSAEMSGLRLLVAAQDQKDASALLRIVSRAGADAPSSREPIVVRFAGGEALPPAGKQTPSTWSTRAAIRVLRYADATGAPIQASVADDGALLVDVDASPGSLTAAEALKAVLDARSDPRSLAEQEIARIPAAKLQTWGRPPAAADTSAWQRSDESDGRWLWLAALALLAIETLIRRGRTSSTSVREEAHAA